MNDEQLLNDEKLLSAIESMLFIHGEPISYAKLAKAIGVTEGDVKKGVSGLEDRYKASGSGLLIVESEREVEMTTRPENAPFVERLLSVERESPLGKATLETLSIIAYRGPITKSHIEAIRGVNSSFSIRTLLLRGLIDRRVNPDRIREYEYIPSFQLLEFLGIARISDLPEYDALSRDGRLAVVEDGEEKMKNES